MSDCTERVVIKIGSNSNMDAAGMRNDRVGHLAYQFAEQIRLGNEPIAVVSGAIAMANAVLLNKVEREDDRITPQMRATRGNATFFDAWISALGSEGVKAGEFLVTHHELDYQPEAKSFVHTIEDYLAMRWLPLVNESGSTDDRETKKLVYGGDNDGLAEVVAEKVGADRICFLTETEGLIGEDGKVIEVVDARNAEYALAVAGEAQDNNGGSGGIRTKVEASLLAASKGRPAHIAHARHSFRSIQKRGVGTYFAPHSRKHSRMRKSHETFPTIHQNQ